GEEGTKCFKQRHWRPACSWRRQALRPQTRLPRAMTKHWRKSAKTPAVFGANGTNISTSIVKVSSLFGILQDRIWLRIPAIFAAQWCGAMAPYTWLQRDIPTGAMRNSLSFRPGWRASRPQLGSRSSHLTFFRRLRVDEAPEMPSGGGTPRRPALAIGA